MPDRRGKPTCALDHDQGAIIVVREREHHVPGLLQRDVWRQRRHRRIDVELQHAGSLGRERAPTPSPFICIAPIRFDIIAPAV
jgi:hypothetical protein